MGDALDPRHILYVAQQSAAQSGSAARGEEALTAAAASGWQVHRAGDARSAGGLLARHPIGVGVARLGTALDDSFREDMDALCRADAQLPWVALLPPEARRSEGVCRFVWESFYDYHTLPPDIARLLTTLGHAHGMAMIARTAAEPIVENTKEAQMVGVCPAMQAVFRTIRKMGAVDAPVLITGESGTGKELAARAIHERSRRAGGPFVAVNCGALPATLIQSELFGHEKGAFTGADRRKIGSIESANGGTLFLDEIGDLSLPLQVNLLRFLEGSVIQRVGSPKEIDVDVRVIAATHEDMEQATARGDFREDLYFRLNVLRLEMPALRARRRHRGAGAVFLQGVRAGGRPPGERLQPGRVAGARSI